MYSDTSHASNWIVLNPKNIEKNQKSESTLPNSIPFERVLAVILSQTSFLWHSNAHRLFWQSFSAAVNLDYEKSVVTDMQSNKTPDVKC